MSSLESGAFAATIDMDVGCITRTGKMGPNGGLMPLLLIYLWTSVSPSPSDLLYVVVMEKRHEIGSLAHTTVTTEKVLQLTLISRVSVSFVPDVYLFSPGIRSQRMEGPPDAKAAFPAKVLSLKGDAGQACD